MPAPAIDKDSFPPRMALLLPIVLFLHQAEEWFGRFPEWTDFAGQRGGTRSVSSLAATTIPRRDPTPSDSAVM
jgi:hypothetical protein